MRNFQYLSGLLQLEKLPTADDRRAAWRQSIAALAGEAMEFQPVPLEGLNPDALLVNVRVAFQDNLVDDLDFLSPPSAAAALYELAAALPTSNEKRELGRRVAKRLQEGDAPTFVALATSLALGSKRGLSGPRMRARVALSLDLPAGNGARADALALALVSRRELLREWVSVASIGSLPSRRLAAQLLEHAAREAATRAAQGDDSAARIFLGERVVSSWTRLLSDREPLVWRHVAAARGLLSDAIPIFGEQIDRDLRPALSMTEWRRAAASLAARVAISPAKAMLRIEQLLASDVFKQDPGMTAAMIYGLPRAAEAEPDTTNRLLEMLVKVGNIDTFDALAELRRERSSDSIGASAAEAARTQLREHLAKGTDDDGKRALIECLIEELAPSSERPTKSLREQIAAAQIAFSEKSAKDAFRAAEPIVGAALVMLDRLSNDNDTTPEGRARVFRTLRELDIGILETSALSDMLVLGAKLEESGPPPLASVYSRLSEWFLSKEKTPVRPNEGVPHMTLRLRRLRGLLHLVDAEGGADDEKNSDLRDRRLQTARVLLARAREDAPSPLRRTLCATLARVSDALVREDVCELSDMLIATVSQVTSEQDLNILAEASAVPDFEAALRAYMVVERSTDPTAPETVISPLAELARGLPPASSPRVEALRHVLIRLARVLEILTNAHSLADLPSNDEEETLAPLQMAVHSLAQLVTGARRRIGILAREDAPMSGASIRIVDLSIDRAVAGARTELEEAVEQSVAVLNEELPAAFAKVIGSTLEYIRNLPAESKGRSRMSRLPQKPAEAPLPPWLPPGRTLGGFFVMRALGSGAGGSVFVVKRADERNDRGAETFALKVPEYDGAAARTLSENEFLRLFREEAGALLAVPPHQNLAHFVTFDAGARPKPILVMELVQGPSLERAIEQRTLGTSSALRFLDGIVSGLEAMHALGIGHLDIKPSNVILRSSRGQATAEEPVLVDFGLAGRKLRPGCATGNYGAPEIWGLHPDGYDPKPMAADIYALGCVAYETLTGKTLFSAPNEMAFIATHASHDGMPEPLQELNQKPEMKKIVDLLQSTLRQDPRNRITATAFRDGLREAAKDIATAAWPLGA
ncbi:MAG: protein kinase [Sandaracinaceae bacterium]|nr:protein kinase [Sandaracinaceae bacterium]